MKTKILFLIIVLSIILAACGAEKENAANHTYEIVINGETITLTSEKYGSCDSHGTSYGKIRVMCKKGSIYVYDVMVDSFEVIE